MTFVPFSDGVRKTAFVDALAAHLSVGFHLDHASAARNRSRLKYFQLEKDLPIWMVFPDEADALGFNLLCLVLIGPKDDFVGKKRSKFFPREDAVVHQFVQELNGDSFPDDSLLFLVHLVPTE